MRLPSRRIRCDCVAARFEFEDEAGEGERLQLVARRKNGHRGSNRAKRAHPDDEKRVQAQTGGRPAFGPLQPRSTIENDGQDTRRPLGESVLR